MARKAAGKGAGGARGGQRGKGAGAAGRSTFEDVKQLVQLMVENDLSELNIQEGPRKILLKRGAGVAVSPGPAATGALVSASAAPAAEELLELKSPMVGTFYAAASPDSEPFVTVGTSVTEDEVVAIVEAMKVMNEIKADCSGTIAEICVRNAQPVEFGQVLFKVRPV